MWHYWKCRRTLPKTRAGLGVERKSPEVAGKVVERASGDKKPQKMHFQGSDGTSTDGGWLDSVRQGWRWKRMVGKCSTRPHAPGVRFGLPEKKHAWLRISLRCFDKTWRSPPCALDGMVGVGKGLRRKKLPEKSQAVRVFWQWYSWSESFRRWERWPEWDTVTERFPKIDSRINRK